MPYLKVRSINARLCEIQCSLVEPIGADEKQALETERYNLELELESMYNDLVGKE